MLPLLKRLLLAVGTTWLITSVVFIMGRSLAAPQLNTEEVLRGSGSQPQLTQAFQHRLGLDQPVFYFRLLPWRWHGTPNQYHTWLQQLAHGHLGYSFRDGTAVEDQLLSTLRLTLPLTLSALLLVGLLALGMAIWVAPRPKLYRWAISTAYFLDSLPQVVVALTLLLLLASPTLWPLFPAFGLPFEADTNWLTLAYYLTLPVLTLVIVTTPFVFLTTAAALAEQWQLPYVQAARAKGASGRRLSWRHVLPNALPVYVTSLSGLIPATVAGALVVEVVFALPGMGRLLATAMTARDLPVLEGGVVLLASTQLLAWLLADIINARLNPRLLWP